MKITLENRPSIKESPVMTRYETLIRAQNLGLRVRNLSSGINIEGAVYSEGEYSIGIQQLSAFCDWVERELGCIEIGAGGYGQYLTKLGPLTLPSLKSLGIPSEDSLYANELVKNPLKNQ